MNSNDIKEKYFELKNKIDNFYEKEMKREDLYGSSKYNAYEWQLFNN
jgi:hypothetical protein